MITLAKVFQNGMVLQRQKKIKIWGTSSEEQSLRICVNGVGVAELESVKGNFEVFLPPMEAMENATLSLEGSVDHLTFEQVDVGEVWVAGGQSNMEFTLRQDERRDIVIPSANDAHIRFYDVAEYVCDSERQEGLKNSDGWDRWMAFNPDDAEYFSAVGYYFAQEIREKLKVPIGIVGCNWGGTSASSWTAENYLNEQQELKVYLEEYAEKAKKFDVDKYTLKRKKTVKKLVKQKEEKGNVSDLQDDFLTGSPSKLTFLKNMPLIMRMMTLLHPMAPQSPYRPGSLYQSMLMLIAGYTCRGVIWYQGESDDVKAQLYHTLFSTMIRCWRDTWEEELPFLFVQLAPFKKWVAGNGKRYPELRQQQELVSKQVPGTYMVSIMDVGLENDIHPKKKQPVGERLGLMARGKIYHEDILCEAPELVTATVQTRNIKLKFLHVGAGLMLQGNSLDMIEIFVGGKRITDYEVSVRRDVLSINDIQVRPSDEVEVRFAWVDYCKVNLYNSAGLPAKPFIWKK